MEKALSEIISQKVLLPGRRENRIAGIRLAAENGKVLGFVMKKSFFPAEKITFDGTSWHFSGVPAPRARGENWLGFRVENRKGFARGRVSEIWVEPQTLFATKIECTKKFLGLVRQRRIYAAENIFAVDPGKRLITVEEENRVFQGEFLKLRELKAMPGMSITHSE